MFFLEVYPDAANWPWHILWPASHVLSFIVGCFVVRKRCESPVGTLFYVTFALPYFIAVLWPFVLLYAFFAGVCAVIGAEPHDSDSRGV